MLFRILAASCVVCLCAAGSAQAQPPASPAPSGAPAQAIPGVKSAQWRLERISATHLRLTGQVEVESTAGTKFFADNVDLHTDTHLLIASGNVVFTNADGRISAEKIEFNTKTQTGTFHQASGIMSLGTKADLSQFAGQDPDIYFYGDTIEKQGPQKYKLTRGGFTTCVQPTPRWELVSGSITLNLDDYAVARNTVLRVKGVPLMYLPVIYYPIEEDERSTGFLLPTYGTSTLRGGSISNGFFWAIGRSHDATIFHDWFTRTGQGAGAEYRYIAGQQSYGNLRLYRFQQKETEFHQAGRVQTLPESSSLELTGTAVQSVTRNIRARARVDYFSDIVTQQLYHQNIYDASRRMRVFETGVSGNFGPVNASALYQRNEVFNSERDSYIYGSTPRLSASLAPQRLLGLPIYAGATSDYAFLPYRYRRDDVVTLDNSVGRFDVFPTVRIPMSRLTFLTVNSSAAFRSTYYSGSMNARGVTVPEPLWRQYFSLRSDVIGPLFNKIWDTPKSTATERMKHLIEPTFGVEYVTAIDNYKRVPILTDNTDFVVGGSTRFTYGMNNRVFYRSRAEDGTRGQTREFVTVGLQQTYYSKAEASQYDTTYASAFRGQKTTNLSPVALTVRVSPTAAFDTNVRMEYDLSGLGMKALSAGGNVTAGGQSMNVSFSRRDSGNATPDTYLSTSTNLRFLGGRATGSYGLSWDIGRSTVVSQSMMASYMAQCCGLQVEFQNYNFPQISSSFPIPSDRRLNFSIVLAGLGTFSNFFGAFGGGGQR